MPARVYRDAIGAHPAAVVPTWLGAHALFINKAVQFLRIECVPAAESRRRLASAICCRKGK